MTTQNTFTGSFGQVAPWTDLINSLEHNGLGQTTDHLQNPAWLKAFLHHWKFAAPPTRPIPHKSLIALRALFREATEKLFAGKTPNPADLRKLNTFMSVWAHSKLFQHQNGFVLQEVPRRATWPWIEAQIAKSFATALAVGQFQRVKVCPDPLCRWIFYDRTKGKTRVWCNEKTCGNRNRVRRSRAANK